MSTQNISCECFAQVLCLTARILWVFGISRYQPTTVGVKLNFFWAHTALLAELNNLRSNRPSTHCVMKMSFDADGTDELSCLFSLLVKPVFLWVFNSHAVPAAFWLMLPSNNNNTSVLMKTVILWIYSMLNSHVVSAPLCFMHPSNGSNNNTSVL